MKLPLRPRLIKLNNRGVAHYILPLAVLMVVGVAGVYSLVSSSANDLSTATTAVNKKAPDTKKKDASPKGYILLYSSQGLYKKAVVELKGTGTSAPENEAATCSGKKLYSGNKYKKITIALSQSKNPAAAKKIKCSSSNYIVTFIKKDETYKAASKKYIALAVQTNYCTFTHASGVTRLEAVVNNKCTGDNDPNEDTITKVTPVITARHTPDPSKTSQKYTWSVELKDPSGEPLSVEQCAGSVDRKFVSAPADWKGDVDPMPLRFSKKTGTCLYKFSGAPNDYKPYKYKYDLSFAGNKFLNAVDGELSFTVTK